ncbi:MAG: hypothetical protein WDN08_18595 [Rhizomicrobium sp.]
MAAAVFGPRVVVGDDHDIGVLGGGFTHQRTLAFVAVAAAAEHNMQLAGNMRADPL